MKKVKRKNSLHPLSLISLSALALTIVFAYLGYITSQYNFFGYLSSTPGALDDLINPVITAATYKEALFSDEILNLQAFNSPFTPLQYFYFRSLDVFYFRPFVQAFGIPNAQTIYFLSLVIVCLYLLVFMLSLRKLSMAMPYQKLSFLSGCFLLAAPPVLFAASRGNAVLLMLSFFTFLLTSIQTKRFYLASAIIGFLAAFQFPYAVFSLLILCMRSRVRCLMVFCTSLITFFFIPLAFLKSGIQEGIKTMIELNARWYETYVLAHEGLLHGVSLLGAEKIFVFTVGETAFSSFLYKSYLFQIILLSLILLFVSQWRVFLQTKSRLFRNSTISFEVNSLVLTLVIIFIIYPQASAAYKQTFLIPALIFAGPRMISKIFQTTFHRIILVSSLTLFVFPHWSLIEYAPGVTVDSVLKPIVLLWFLFRLVRVSPPIRLHTDF